MITMKGIMIFAGGVVVGVIAGVYVTKRKYERILEEQEEELTEKLRKEYGGIDAFVEEEKTEEEDSYMEVPERKGSFATNYQSFYKPADPAEGEAPKEMSEKKKPPKAIRNEEFGTTGFREVYLDYYTEDQALVIADETEAKEIDEVKDWIGDVLEKFDFDNNDEQDKICVRNFDRRWDIQITKRYDRFAPSEYADYEGEE